MIQNPLFLGIQPSVSMPLIQRDLANPSGLFYPSRPHLFDGIPFISEDRFYLGDFPTDPKGPN